MAHAIDFKVLPPLLEAFNAANCRALKVRIENEAFALAKEVPTMQNADPQTEFARMKAECIVAQEACFVLFVDADEAWNLFSFVPDDAPVRDKMLYSSSFLDLETFSGIYGSLAAATRKKVDPEGSRPSVFEKTAHPSVLGCEELVLGY